MPKYQRFVFTSYELDRDAHTIKLNYALDDAIHFTETFTLPTTTAPNYDHPDLDTALFALHLSGGASYYKTYCPPEIEVKSGKLNPEQAKFWDKLYTHGLGQFWYENQLDWHDRIKFPAAAESSEAKLKPHAHEPKRALVPFGGGKDSIVTTELLRGAGVDQKLFRLRSHPLITELAGLAKLPLLEVGRTLDPQVIELNKQDAYNGHIPITAHISFLTLVIGLIYGYDSVFFSSERSSSYGNVDYLGMEVNHQWSKSREAETMLREYASGYVTQAVSLENVLRPLSELHIAKIFSAYPQYFNTATSCNRNWVLAGREPDAPRWCGTCPKCAFTFSLLAAWLPAKTVVPIFGHNLFDDEALLPLYRELWGVVGFKPFECVGTPEEAQAAFYLAGEKKDFSDSVVMKEFTEKVLPEMSNPEGLVMDLLTPDDETLTKLDEHILQAGDAI